MYKMSNPNLQLTRQSLSIAEQILRGSNESVSVYFGNYCDQNKAQGVEIYSHPFLLPATRIENIAVDAFGARILKPEIMSDYYTSAYPRNDHSYVFTCSKSPDVIACNDSYSDYSMALNTASLDMNAKSFNMTADSSNGICRLSDYSPFTLVGMWAGSDGDFLLFADRAFGLGPLRIVALKLEEQKYNRLVDRVNNYRPIHTQNDAKFDHFFQVWLFPEKERLKVISILGLTNFFSL